MANIHGDKTMPTPQKVQEKAPEKPAVEAKETQPVQPRRTNAPTQRPVPNVQPRERKVPEIQRDETITASLHEYVLQNESAKDITEKGQASYSLYLKVIEILKTDNQTDFRIRWTSLLEYVRKNPAHINHYNTFGAGATWPGDKRSWDIFKQLLFIVIETADAKARFTTLNKMDLSMLLNNLDKLNRRARNNISDYYRL